MPNYRIYLMVPAFEWGSVNAKNEDAATAQVRRHPDLRAVINDLEFPWTLLAIPEDPEEPEGENPMSTKVRVYYQGYYDAELDKRINKALADAGLEWYASGYDGEERELCFSYDPQSKQHYVPVIRLAQSELEAIGGLGLDLEAVAKKVGNAFIEMGYWDVLKAVVQEMKRDG
jgi:hypothetical protein